MTKNEAILLFFFTLGGAGAVSALVSNLVVTNRLDTLPDDRETIAQRIEAIHQEVKQLDGDLWAGEVVIQDHALRVNVLRQDILNCRWELNQLKKNSK